MIDFNDINTDVLLELFSNFEEFLKYIQAEIKAASEIIDGN